MYRLRVCSLIRSIVVRLCVCVCDAHHEDRMCAQHNRNQKRQKPRTKRNYVMPKKATEDENIAFYGM